MIARKGTLKNLGAWTEPRIRQTPARSVADLRAKRTTRAFRAQYAQSMSRQLRTRTHKAMPCRLNGGTIASAGCTRTLRNECRQNGFPWRMDWTAGGSCAVPYARQRICHAAQHPQTAIDSHHDHRVGCQSRICERLGGNRTRALVRTIIMPLTFPLDSHISQWLYILINSRRVI